MSNEIKLDSVEEAIEAIKNGEVGYISKAGSKPEEGSCLMCIAVPKGNLTLDA